MFKPFALLFATALAVSSVVIAQDGAAQDPQERGGRRARLVKPWSQLTTLSEDQKDKIIEIHGDALAKIKEIRDKEEADIMALLTPENTAELEAFKEKEKAEQKARAGGRKQDGDKDEQDR